MHRTGTLRPFRLMLLALLLPVSCHVPDEPAPTPEVGVEYLQSESYRTFERKLRTEQRQAGRERELIGMIIRRIAQQTEREIELPASFNTAAVGRFTGPERRILLREGAVSDSPFGRYSYYPVGRVSRGEITALFFILRRNEIPYVDTDLMMAGMGPKGRYGPYRRSPRSANSTAISPKAVSPYGRIFP